MIIIFLGGPKNGEKITIQENSDIQILLIKEGCHPGFDACEKGWYYYHDDTLIWELYNDEITKAIKMINEDEGREMCVQPLLLAEKCIYCGNIFAITPQTKNRDNNLVCSRRECRIKMSNNYYKKRKESKKT